MDHKHLTEAEVMQAWVNFRAEQSNSPYLGNTSVDHYEEEFECFLSDQRDQAHTDGWNDGFDEGREEGHNEGYDDGYEEGRDDGYNRGYVVGHAEGLTEGS